MKRKRKNWWLRRFWNYIVKSNSGQGCKIGIPERKLAWRGRR